MVTAGPVTFRMAVGGSLCRVSEQPSEGKSRGSDGSVTVATPTAAGGPRDARQRFAGQAYQHLRLSAKFSQQTGLIIILSNEGQKPLTIKTWAGRSPDDLTVWGPTGQPVPLSEEGRITVGRHDGVLEARELGAGKFVEMRSPLPNFSS